jgi:N-acetylglucosamine kinase-like BadF-type ATPase
MSLVIGIDGGGSKCTAALSDGERVLATHTSGGCNLNTISPEKVRLALEEAVRGAVAQAGIDLATVRSVCAGVAGAASQQTADGIREMMASILPPSTLLQVVGDTTIALEAEFGGGAGVVCISGTGSIAFGRNERGEFARAGGWGRPVSDEGSGHWIGQRAIAECLHALDMGRSSSLIAGIMNHWRIATREQLVQRCNREAVPNFSELFPVAVAAGAQGDGLACEILIDAATRLARLTQIVVRRLWVGRTNVDVAVTGGVFSNAEHIVQVFTNVIRIDRPEVKVRLSQREPYCGAISLAQKALLGSTN